LSTTNPTWPDPGSNPGRRGGKPATNHLSYGVAIDTYINLHYIIYTLDDQGVGFWVPVGPIMFSSERRPERLWCPPNLLFNGYRGAFSTAVETPGRDADHSPTSVEIKKTWTFTFTPSYVFMV
jgi:hypothetical protein